MLPLCTTWAQLTQTVFPKLASLGLAATATAAGAAAAAAAGPELEELEREWDNKLARHSVPGWAWLHPDALLDAIHTAFSTQRCGVVVVCRGGRVQLMAPFANAEYRNTWHDRVMLGASGETPAQYAAAKAAATGKPPEAWLPSDRWWLNGATVCNVMPPNVWGAAHLAEVFDMLENVARFVGPLPDCTFLLNKRDHPQAPGATSKTYVPVLSFYSGEGFNDLLIPLTEDWGLATRGAVPLALPPPAIPKAVWRGGATGAGLTWSTNPRLKLVTAANPELVDARLTHWNHRDRLLPGPHPGSLVMDFLRPETMAALGPLAPVMPLETQARLYSCVIYVDGHSAANRYGALMLCGRPILKVTSSATLQPAGLQWLLPGLVGCRVAGVETTASADADHFVIDEDLGNLSDTVRWVNENPEAAQAVAQRAGAKAPTVTKILSTWWSLLLKLNAYEAAAAELPPSGWLPWYSPWDPQYGRRLFQEQQQQRPL